MTWMRRLLAAYMTAEPVEMVADLGVVLTVGGVVALWGWEWALLVAGLLCLLLASGMLQAMVGRVRR